LLGDNYQYGLSTGETAATGVVISKTGIENYQLNYVKPTRGPGSTATSSLQLNGAVNISGNTYAAGLGVAGPFGALYSFNSSGTLTTQKYYIINSGSGGFVGIQNISGNLLTAGGGSIGTTYGSIFIFDTSLNYVTGLSIQGYSYFPGCCGCFTGSFNSQVLSNIVSGTAWVGGYGSYDYFGTQGYGATVHQLSVTSTSISRTASYNLSNNYRNLNGSSLYQDSNNLYIALNESVGQIAILSFNQSTGTLNWKRGITTANGGVNYGAITADSSGNVYVAWAAGLSTATISCYIAKYNSSGTLQWQRKFASTSTGTVNSVSSIQINSQGSLVVSGSIAYTYGQNLYSFVLQVPTDGSRTGTYTIGSYGTFSYSSSSLSTYTTSGATTNVTSYFIDGTPSHTLKTPATNAGAISSIPYSDLVI
jgi:hypothetical protein